MKIEKRRIQATITYKTVSYSTELQCPFNCVTMSLDSQQPPVIKLMSIHDECGSRHHCSQSGSNLCLLGYRSVLCNGRGHWSYSSAEEVAYLFCTEWSETVQQHVNITADPSTPVLLRDSHKRTARYAIKDIHI